MTQKQTSQPLSPDLGLQSTDQKTVLFYVVLFAVAFLPRLLHLLWISHNPFFNYPIIDSQTNDTLAQKIAEGYWLGHKPFWQAPLYPYFLGIIYTIFGHNLFLVRFTQILLGSVNCLLLYRVAKTAFNPRVALIGFLIAAFYGPFLFFDAQLLNPVLVIFFNLLVVLILFSYRREPKWIKLLLAGIVLGLSSITHGLAMTFVPFGLLWLVIALSRIKAPVAKIVGSCLLFLLGFLLVISLTTMTNWVASGDLVFVSSNSGLNFFIGNNANYDYTTSIRPGIQWEELIQRPIQEGLNKPSQRSAYFWKQAFSYMTGQPLSYLKLLGRKLFFIADGFEIKRNQDPYLFRQYSLPLRLLLWKWVIYFPFGLLFPLSLMGLVAFFRQRSRSQTRNSRPILLFYFLLSQALALLFFFVSARYRLPLVPFLIIFASFGIYSLYQLLKARRMKPAAVLLVIFLAFLVISNLSRHRLTAKDLAEEHYNLGMVYARQDKLDQAMQEYQETVSLQPDHLMAHFEIALIYDQQNKPEQAEKKYLEVIDLFPRAALAYNNLGLIYEKRGDYLKAEEYYIKANDAHPLLPDPLYNLANLFLEEKDYGLAMDRFNRALALDAYYYQAYNGLGDLNYRINNIDEAIRNFKNAIQIEPSYAVAHNNLGTCYIKKGQRQLAFREFETAKQLDSTYASAYVNLGNWYLEDSQPQKAIPLYQRAVELKPDDPSVHYYLAIAYGTSGRDNDATAELYRALAADSSFAPARELLRNVTGGAEK
jgi:tetratricopeptide (TPR) repeat protein